MPARKPRSDPDQPESTESQQNGEMKDGTSGSEEKPAKRTRLRANSPKADEPTKQKSKKGTEAKSETSEKPAKRKHSTEKKTKEVKDKESSEEPKKKRKKSTKKEGETATEKPKKQRKAKDADGAQASEEKPKKQRKAKDADGAQASEEKPKKARSRSTEKSEQKEKKSKKAATETDGEKPKRASKPKTKSTETGEEKQPMKKSRSRTNVASAESENQGMTESLSLDFRMTTSDDEPESEEEIQPGVKKVEIIFSHRILEDGQGREFYVKLKNRPYRECEWVPESLVLGTAEQRYRIYTKRYSEMSPPQPPFYDPAYEKPEKVITEKTENGNKQYLVKWTNLDYDNCTWETDVGDDSLIREYMILNKIPEFDELFGPATRPEASEFRPITKAKESKHGYFVRQYQLAGLNFLVNSWYCQRNAILADEMGLGKTLQASIFLDYLATQQKMRGPYLIVAPLSTIPHWEREVKEWTDLGSISFHGIKARRKLMKQYEFYYQDTEIPKFNVLITTYEYVMKEADLFKRMNWKCIVIDEAHRLKNHESKLFNTMKEFGSDFKLLLTGTPLQNNTEELWALLNYLDPNAFKDLSAFKEKFATLRESDEIIELQAILRPLMLRRLKGDVEKQLAPLEEIIIECPMTGHQKAYYKSIYEKNIEFLTRGAHQGNSTNLRNISMELRKVCNHPYLIQGAEDQILVERKQLMKLDVYDEPPPFFNEETLVRTAGKMILLDKLLSKLKRDGHRVLIFSQMTRMLDILQDYLDYKRYKYERLDGGVRGDLRQQAIDRYNAPDSEDFVFLLCTKAGGLGINLTSADTVIIYDSDWNPQNDIQATARCHRIGQKKDVKAYRFITAKSYERKMFDTASIKLGLDHAVLESAKNGETKADEMEKLLRLGAYYAFEDDEDTTEQFGEEDIESVLSRSMKIRHESVVGGEGSTFSKAEFKLDDDEANIDISNPDFWKKYQPEVQEDDIGFDECLLTIAERRRLMREESVPSALDEVAVEVEASTGKFTWSKNKISDLQTNFLRYGWGRWRIIGENCKSNPPLADIKTMCNIMLRWLISSSSEKFPVLEAIHRKSVTPESTKAEAIFIKKKDKKLFEPLVITGSAWKLGRLDLMYFINGLVMSCENAPDDIPICEVNAQKPTEWWTVDDDKRLIHNTFIRGFSQYTDVTWSNPEDPVTSSKLTSRLRSLITGLKNAYMKYKEQRGEELPFNCDTLNKALATWSKKDHRQIVNVLTNFGFASPEEVQRVANIAKSPDQIRAYMQEVIDYCQDVVSELENPSLRGLAEKVQAGTCTRILQRVELFRNLRENLDDPAVNADDLEVAQYVADHGLWNLGDAQTITSRFGTDGLEGKVVRYLKDIFRPKKQKLPKSPSLPKGSTKPIQPIKVDISTIPRDEEGNVIYPLRLGNSLVIHSMGKVVSDREAFHTKRYVYPVGYVADRTYPSILNPFEKAWYTCKILDDGGPIPVFRVEMKENPEIFFEAGASSAAWLSVVRAVEEERRKLGAGGNRSLTISGPEYFGFSSPVVAYLMTQLEGVDALTKFEKNYIITDDSEIPDAGVGKPEAAATEPEPQPKKPPQLRHSARIRQRIEVTIDLSKAVEGIQNPTAPELVMNTEVLKEAGFAISEETLKKIVEKL